MNATTKILATAAIAFCHSAYAIGGNDNETEWQGVASNQLVWPTFVPVQSWGKRSQELVTLTGVKVVFKNSGTAAATAQLFIDDKNPHCKLLGRNGGRPRIVLVLNTSVDAALQVSLRDLAEGGGHEAGISGDPVNIGAGTPKTGYLAFLGYCD